MKHRKPTKLKELLGNPGHRPLKDDEPQPQGDAVKPEFLEGREAEIWDEYAPQLSALGLLTAVDATTFAMWCSLSAEFEENPRKMQAARIAQMRALGSSFGMDPSSRTRLRTIDAEGNKDPVDRYFETEGSDTDGSRNEGVQ